LACVVENSFAFLHAPWELQDSGMGWVMKKRAHFARKRNWFSNIKSAMKGVSPSLWILCWCDVRLLINTDLTGYSR